MSLSRRQLRPLREIERDVAGSDPRLSEFFLFFTESYRDCEMPTVERVTRWPSRMLAKLWRGASVSERVVIWCAGDRSAGNWEDP